MIDYFAYSCENWSIILHISWKLIDFFDVVLKSNRLFRVLKTNRLFGQSLENCSNIWTEFWKLIDYLNIVLKTNRLFGWTFENWYFIVGFSTVLWVSPKIPKLPARIKSQLKSRKSLEVPLKFESQIPSQWTTAQSLPWKLNISSLLFDCYSTTSPNTHRNKFLAMPLVTHYELYCIWTNAQLHLWNGSYGLVNVFMESECVCLHSLRAVYSYNFNLGRRL